MDSETEAGDPFFLQTIKVGEKEEDSSNATVGEKGQEKNWRGGERRRKMLSSCLEVNQTLL